MLDYFGYYSSQINTSLLLQKVGSFKNWATNASKKLTITNFLSMPDIGITANGFSLNGIAISLSNFNNDHTYLLRLLTSVLLIAKVQADDFYKVAFKDPASLTNYQLSLNELANYFATNDQTTVTVQEASSRIISACNGIIEEIIFNSGDLIEQLKTEVGNGPGAKEIIAEQLYRATNATVQALFENCVKNEMQKSLEPPELDSGEVFKWVGIVVGSIAGCYLMGYLTKLLVKQVKNYCQHNNDTTAKLESSRLVNSR